MARKKSPPAEAPATPSQPLSVGAMLREAIRKRDWSGVGQVYRLLTGEDPGQLPPQPPSEAEVLLAKVRELLGASPPEPPMPEDGHDPDVERARPTDQPSPTSPTKKDYRPPFRFLRMTCATCKQTADVHPQCVPVALGADDVPTPYQCDSCQVRGLTETVAS